LLADRDGRFVINQTMMTAAVILTQSTHFCQWIWRTVKTFCNTSLIVRCWKKNNSSFGDNWSVRH